jgi:hypothetical protein
MKLRIQDLPVAAAVTSSDLTIIERSNGVTYQTTTGQINGAGLGTANVSTALVTPALGTTARSLAALLGDSLNLKDLGAALSGTPGDQTTIDGIYSGLANGSVVNVPTGGLWSGTLTSPNPAKEITWLLEGTWPNSYNAFVGDGDLGVGFYNAQASFWKQSLNTNEYNQPVLATFWNQNANYTGPYSSNYTQLPAIEANYLTGPTSTGNTSAFSALGKSFGTNNTASYEVLYDGNVFKYGNNSLWGHVIEINDLSGRLPQAFSSWMMELDNLANGHDVSPMDPNNAYYTPAVGNRTGIFLSLETMKQPSWAASTAVSVLSTTQRGTTPANVIVVTATDTFQYTYVCSTGGITGATQPTWNPPAVFTGSIAAGGVLTVTALEAGSTSIASNQIITGNGFVAPVSTPIEITSQISGTTGGIGTYQTNYTGSGVAAAGMYAAPQITDGTAVWDFGTDYAARFHSGFFVATEGNSSTYAAVGTAFGLGKSEIYNAAFDCSQATILAGGAALRIAPNHQIDFSYLGTQASQNLRTLSYSTYAGGDTLAYINPAGTAFQAKDTGAFLSLHNTLDDGSGFFSAIYQGATYANITPTSGATIAFNYSQQDLRIDSAAVAALTLTFGIPPKSSAKYFLKFYNAVTALTLTGPGSGWAFQGAPSSIPAGGQAFNIIIDTPNKVIWF